jgi:hypothetical protein
MAERKYALHFESWLGLEHVPGIVLALVAAVVMTELRGPRSLIGAQRVPGTVVDVERVCTDSSAVDCRYVPIIEYSRLPYDGGGTYRFKEYRLSGTRAEALAQKNKPVAMAYRHDSKKAWVLESRVHAIEVSLALTLLFLLFLYLIKSVSITANPRNEL